MTAMHAEAIGATAPVPLKHPANAAAQQTHRVSRRKVSRTQFARLRGGRIRALDELRPGYQRIADMYGLPINIFQDPLNGKFIVWAGRPAFGAAIGPTIETIVPQAPL